MAIESTEAAAFIGAHGKRILVPEERAETPPEKVSVYSVWPFLYLSIIIIICTLHRIAVVRFASCTMPTDLSALQSSVLSVSP